MPVWELQIVIRVAYYKNTLYISEHFELRNKLNFNFIFPQQFW